MAKISPVSIKYIIHARFEAEGAVEKPDIIGAIFGQTEGLLGDDLEMRELQKSGKIGRIDVSINFEEGKTKGEIEVPSAIGGTTELVAVGQGGSIKTRVILPVRAHSVEVSARDVLVVTNDSDGVPSVRVYRRR